MNPLIRITPRALGSAPAVQTVNGRDLHAFLEVGKDFSNWIKDRIDQYGFQQGHDFEVFANSGENPTGGRPAKEYALSLDMAKELSMVERNEKGKQARQYFIECERQAKAHAADPHAFLNDPSRMRGLLLTYTEKVLTLEATVAQQAPKVAALDRIATISDGSLNITETAKVIGLRPGDLFKWMQAHAWIYRRVGGSGWVAYQPRLQQGVLEHKITTVSRSDGSEKLTEQVRVTAKGIARLSELLNVEAIA